MMSGDDDASVVIKIHNDLVTDLIEMSNSPPGTEQGFRRAHRALVQYAKENKHDGSNRGMSRLLTGRHVNSHLEDVKTLSKMSATSARLDDSLEYVTTDTIPTFPPGLWDGSTGLSIGTASYIPVVDKLKHEQFEVANFGKSSVGITFKKLLQSGTKDPNDFDIGLFDFLPVYSV